MSKSQGVSTLKDFVDKINTNTQYREQFFGDPSAFLEEQTGISVGQFRDEINSYVKKLKTTTPGVKFYLPGQAPSEMEEWLREHAICFI